ncbi:MAG: hypothetical protein ABIS38_08690, partial [Sphingomicrobium sp.]
SGLSARWSPVVDSILPLMTAVVEPETFYRKLSNEDGFLGEVKGKLDAMLTASGASNKHGSFSAMVATS